MTGGDVLERALMSAPARISTRTTSVWPCAAAHIKAFCSRTFSFAFTFAPFSSSTFTASTRPLRAAVINADSPSRSAAFGSAPALIKSPMTVALPFRLARASGVTPWRFVALTFAPARISASTIETSSRLAAQCSAVAPSMPDWFTSAFWRSSACTAAWSPLFAASTSEAGWAAAIEATASRLTNRRIGVSLVRREPDPTH